ncbi:hypothetical protein HPP92_028968 [Vanilla planifolia]|uniref:Uncharacterized protein n=1 Tax=Vanilla planifolia TaxID=51239 RepID=A0A835U282_VANPL|nr:hypothetical protein HPP92_028968 [Vanilla planifolia]KAG0446183.1 hypothetical protein HPP92_028957 [Vanilla planifolia]
MPCCGGADRLGLETWTNHATREWGMMVERYQRFGSGSFAGYTTSSLRMHRWASLALLSCKLHPLTPVQPVFTFSPLELSQALRSAEITWCFEKMEIDSEENEERCDKCLVKPSRLSAVVSGHTINPGTKEVTPWPIQAEALK